MTSAVLFDLDGTLVDTAPDLGYALNLLLAEYGRPALSADTIRPYASHGTKGLLSLGFDITPQDPSFVEMRDAYLAHYTAVLTRSPTLFNGMANVLDSLNQQHIPWGIVTNKPGRFTTPIVQYMGLDKHAVCIISGDDAPKPKPSPATLFLACERVGIMPSRCLYVGDAARDVEAGKAAGMQTAVALYGYIDTENDQPRQWAADAYIDSPEGLLALI